MGNPKFPQQGAGEPSLTPSSPTYGLLQADFVYQEDVDSGHPLNLDYFIPINCQTVKTARLSFKLRLYRTYSTFSATTTQGQSATHTHPHSATHAHTHGHTTTLQSAGGNPAIFVGWNAGATQWQGNVTGPTTGPADNSDSTSAAPGTTDANTQDHTHLVTVSGSLGVSEDVNNSPTYNVLFDGVDRTASIIPAGPYSTDQVELDVTKFISTKVDRAWHTVSLSPNARGRIQAVMRVLYNSNLV